MEFEIGVFFFFVSEVTEGFLLILASQRKKKILGELEYLLSASQSLIYSFAQNIFKNGKLLLTFTDGK